MRVNNAMHFTCEHVTFIFLPSYVIMKPLIAASLFLLVTVVDGQLRDSFATINKAVGFLLTVVRWLFANLSKTIIDTRNFELTEIFVINLRNTTGHIHFVFGAGYDAIPITINILGSLITLHQETFYLTYRKQ